MLVIMFQHLFIIEIQDMTGLLTAQYVIKFYTYI